MFEDLYSCVPEDLDELGKQQIELIDAMINKASIKEDLKKGRKNGDYETRLGKHVKMISKLAPKDKKYKRVNLLEVIKRDDCKTFINLINERDFDPEEKVHVLFFYSEDEYLKRKDIEKRIKYNFLLKQLKFKDHGKDCFKYHAYEDGISVLSACALYGAVKCFKVALVNEVFDESDISKYAIAGGNNEIIHELERRGHTFDNCFIYSVKYHRYSISEWLLRNYKCEKVTLEETIRFFNDRAFFFVLRNNIDSSAESIQKALITSVSKSNFPIMKYLIEKCHADFNCKDEKGISLVYVAAKHGNFQAIEYLINVCHMEVEPNDEKGRNLLHLVTEFNDFNAIQYISNLFPNFIAMKDSNGRTPLINAIIYQSDEVIKFMVEKIHACINVKDNKGLTPIHYSIKYKKDKLFHYFIETCHIDPCIVDNKGNTILHMAVKYEMFSLLDYIIDTCKISIDTKNNEGRTPIFYTSKYNTSSESIDLLINKYHANISVRDNKGLTILHYCAYKNGTEQLRYILKNKLIDVEAKDNEGKTALHHAAMPNFNKFINISLKDYADVAGLHDAVMDFLYPNVQILVKEFGANIEARDNEGKTPNISEKK